MKNFYKKGFTLLEVLIVIAIIVIFAVVSFSQLSKTKNYQILKSSGEDISSVLNKTRSQTLASLNSLQYGVHFETNRIVIFSGTVYNSGNSSNEIVNISSPAYISSISLTGGAVDLYFNRLTGTASKTGIITISLSSDNSLTKTITISSVGSITLN